METRVILDLKALGDLRVKKATQANGVKKATRVMRSHMLTLLRSSLLHLKVKKAIQAHRVQKVTPVKQVLKESRDPQDRMAQATPSRACMPHFLPYRVPIPPAARETHGSWALRTATWCISGTWTKPHGLTLGH